MSAIQWYNNPKFDAPELGSPQPCIHGAGCVFTVKNAEGVVVPGCCRYVHPGEEGNGRRLFPESVINGQHKNACVRLTGKAGFYERCRLRLPWQEWCARNNIPYTPNKAGERHAPVKRVPIGYKAPQTMELVKGVTDDLNKRITASKLTDAEKAEYQEMVTGAVEDLQKVHNAIDRAAGVPLSAEESRIEGLTQILKDSFDAATEPVGEKSAKVYSFKASVVASAVAEVAADPAMTDTLRELAAAV
jgi:hypothetical protein